jgi:hypothetical protein
VDLPWISLPPIAFADRRAQSASSTGCIRDGAPQSLRITVDGGRSAVRASVEVSSSSSTIEAVHPVP